jgi:hypothetical protein
VNHDLPGIGGAQGGGSDLPRFAGGGTLMLGGAVVGVIGLAATALLGMRAPRETLFAYLVAFVFWLGLSIGAMTLVLANNAAGAKWNVTVRRLGETLGAVAPLFALLFLPLLLGARHVWFWVQPTGAISAETARLLAHKAPYLNLPSFSIRAVIYFAIWTAYAFQLRSYSIEQDASGDPRLTRKMRSISPLGLLLFILSVTFAAFDWLMSLQPTWYSTIFGLYIYAGAFVASMALVCLIVTGLRASETPWGKLLTVDQQHNLGKLLFAFICFWAYMAFSQYMLIWAGNLPQELQWIISRSKGVWRPVGQFILVGHFIIPFFLLLSRDLKRNTKALAAVAVWILAVHYVDLYWVVMPAADYSSLGLSLAHFTAFVGIGGVSVAVAALLLRGASPVPVKDPYLEDALRYVQP